MKTPENNNWLDDALAKEIGSKKPQPNFQKWQQDHPQAIKTLTARSGTDGNIPSTPLPSIWRTIMKTKLTKLAAAAVIIIGIMIGINYFGGSIDGATIAWSDVVSATNNTSIFHWVVTSEMRNGTIKSGEQWIDTQQGLVFVLKKLNDSVKCFRLDGPAGIMETYDSSTQILYRADLADELTPLVSQGLDFLDYLFKLIAHTGPSHSHQNLEWKQSPSAVEGHTTFVCNITRGDEQKIRVFIEVDNTTRKPLSLIAQEDDASNSMRGHRKTQMLFDYPQTMPTSFAEVGINIEGATVIDKTKEQ